jgi:hypothetical protein
MRRYNLVFVQCGALFDVFSDDLLASVPHRRLKASDFAGGSGDSFEDVGILLLTGVEEFARSGKAADATLGQLRVCVDKALDEGVDVCLLSRAPKIAYVVVPGSSVIEDAAFYAIPILGVRELLPGVQLEPESVLPAVGLRGCDDLRQLFTAALSELGSAVLEALDHGIFEVDHTQDFIRHLDVRVLEALRGAGFVVTIDGRVEFSVPRRFVEFREAVANALAGVAEPPADLASISEGLWFIERRIRGSLRRLAISLYGDKWRKRVLHGDLGEKVLERARVDAHVGARSVAELRDPIEWLTLGELLEVTRSSAFGGLHFDEVAWRRFTQDITPIRNRLSHMRLIKKGDRETVRLWRAMVKNTFV